MPRVSEGYASAGHHQP